MTLTPPRLRIYARHRRPRSVRRSLIVTAVGGLLLLTGCVAQPPAQLSTSSSPGYLSADQTIVEIAPKDRTDPVAFAGPLDAGEKADSAKWLGSVVVVNFWYAACPPCRAEAPDLAAVSQTYRADGVVFVGINVRDSAATAATFEKQFGITYPSILDATSGAVQSAFAGKAAPNAVPTTIVLDRNGRMAARILGQLPTRDTLTALIDTVLAERDG